MRPLILAALLPALPAQALTPEELWSRWQAQAEDWGLALRPAAVEEEPDGTLVLRGLGVLWPGEGVVPLLPGGSGDVILRPLGDGSVEIDPGLAPNGLVEQRRPDGLSRLELPDLSLRAREDGAGLRYEGRADRLRLLEEGGASLFALEVRAPTIALAGLGTVASPWSLRLEAQGYASLSETPDPFGDGTGSQATVHDGDLSAEGTLVLPEGARLADILASAAALVAALEGGLVLDLAVEGGASRQAVTATGFPFPFDYVAESGPATGSLRLDREALAIGTTYSSGTATFGLPDLGLENLALAFEGGDVLLRLPVAPGEWRTRLAIGDITADEAAWAALDPEGHLPRGPFRLVLDLAGRMTADWAAVAAAAEGETEPPPPPRIESVELRRLDLAGLGLAATGSGAFLFPDGAFPEDGSLPRAEGAAILRLTGLDRLLDSLVAGGWLAPQDALAVRLALGAGFRAVGPDIREGRLETAADGTLRLNDLPLPP
ncbi:DUF2125 domain-containing protein [Rubellimicrobium sp. CFH 75288]|uniref:DUF2125 domain-containing protein n=1 Tax=Rubellimicrobium sp. CFH 75288 TaxID=2697034 RepID=UPI0014127145|nr:DUF2125 domain-containing protein [Rubellimicrobium sp. CFH 75288]NAZ36710.1 hypothetical protein [Rubellimicrobium sp. CFH 75288]